MFFERFIEICIQMKALYDRSGLLVRLIRLNINSSRSHEREPTLFQEIWDLIITILNWDRHIFQEDKTLEEFSFQARYRTCNY